MIIGIWGYGRSTLDHDLQNLINSWKIIVSNTNNGWWVTWNPNYYKESGFERSIRVPDDTENLSEKYRLSEILEPLIDFHEK